MPTVRRTALAALGLPAALLVPVVATADPVPPVEDRRSEAPLPNVVVIMADDLGWADLGTGRTNGGHPNDFIETPAIDRLAEEGMSFDNAYSAVNCAPTRSALLTGLSAPRPDNNIYIVGSLDRGGDDTLLEPPPQGLEDGDDALPDRAVTVGETLQAADYRTGYVGKFHVTRTGADVTRVHGFDENLGGTNAGAPAQYHAQDGRFATPSVGPELDRFGADYTQEYVDQYIAPYSHDVPRSDLDALVGSDKHVTDALADATIDFVERNKRQPFFTFFSEYAVHSPVSDQQARADLRAKYRSKPPGSGPSRPGYAALVEGLDQSVARVIDHLESTPDPRNPGHVLADNTLVLFTSDNGGRTDLGADNGPLKGQKGELDEGGVRVPLIAWSRGDHLVRGGEVNHSVVNGTDLHPTLASLAGTDVADDIPLDGVSLRNALRHGAVVDRPRFAHLPGYLVDTTANGGGRDQRPQSSVRDGRWKAIYSYEDRSWELYDVQADIGERADLADERPDVLARLGEELVHWLDTLDAPLATLAEGHPALRLTVDGVSYADGHRRVHHGDVLRIEPGEEVPLVLAR